MRDWRSQFRLSVRLMMMAGVVWAGMPKLFWGSEPADDAARQSAAVALNYSRAAFHRIRRNPSVRVLWEEQEKILNHLNLNGIADEEVVKLYAAVLDEIAQVQLADREKELLQEKYRRQVQTSLGVNSFALAGQVLTAQYAAAVRTGCTSWWDFRSLSQNRELDVWRVDKERMNKLVEKSAQFLDVSWKMARNKQIPDRWLVRGDDLDKLEEAWREPDLSVRLRVLKRMEAFMECYPPYWYYVARTQQAQGQLFAAGETYDRLAKIGHGHFRKDEMLAAGLANRALIQAFLNQPAAPATARQALGYSTDVWEANLICAAVLQRHRQIHEAEDAILRNLDVGLERSQSQVALVSLYYFADERVKLASQLVDPNIVQALPMSALLACAAKLGDSMTPPTVAQCLQKSLQASPRFNLGRDDLVVQAGPNWYLQHAALTLQWGDKVYQNPRITAQNNVVNASFDGVAEFGTNWNGGGEARDVTLTIEYPDAPPVKLTLQLTGAPPAAVESASPLVLANRRYPVYRLSSLEQDKVRLSLEGGVLKSQGESTPVLGGTPAPRTIPAGNTTPKDPADEPYVTTPPIEIPVVSPL